MQTNKKFLLLLLVTISGIFIIPANAQDFKSDLLKNNGTLSARINQYNPDSYNYLVGRESVDLNSGNAKLGFKETNWQITSQIKPMEKAGKYEVTVFFNCLSGEIKNASVSVDFNFSD